MYRDKEGFTPKQRAYDFALGWLLAVYQGRTGDIAELGLAPSQEAKVRAAVARLHDDLLDRSGLDSSPLGKE